jgi:NitT/TauT family transport system substrate-binding protein
MEKKTMKIMAVAVIVIVVAGSITWFLLPDNEPNDGAIYYTALAPNTQKQAISDGTVSGGVLWEPFVADAIIDNTAHVIIQSGDVWSNHPCCVIAASSQFAEDNPELVERMIKVHIIANEWILNTLNGDHNATNYTKMMNAGALFSFGDLDHVPTVELATNPDNISFCSEITQETKNYLVNYTDAFIDLGIVKNETIEQRGYDNITDFVNNIVDTSYYSNAINIQPSESIVGTVKLGYLTKDLHQYARVIAMDKSIWGDKSLYEIYGIEVEVENPSGFANGAFLMDAFAADAIDVGYLGSPPAMQKALNVGIDIKIVSLVNEEGSAIIANNDIESFSDFAGKTIATPGPGSIQHLLLLAYADKQGFDVMVKTA